MCSPETCGSKEEGLPEMGNTAHSVRPLDLREKRKDKIQQRIAQSGTGHHRRVVKGAWALVKMNMGFSVGKIKKKKEALPQQQCPTIN